MLVEKQQKFTKRKLQKVLITRHKMGIFYLLLLCGLVIVGGSWHGNDECSGPTTDVIKLDDLLLVLVRG